MSPGIRSFVASGVTVAACLGLWTVFVLEAMTTATRVEFDRRSKTLRQRNVLGLKSTDRLDRFARVQVVRAMSFRGSPQIRVNLKRDDGYSDASQYLVAIYGWPGEAGEKAAREWGERLARFLTIPLEVDL